LPWTVIFLMSAMITDIIYYAQPQVGLFESSILLVYMSVFMPVSSFLQLWLCSIVWSQELWCPFLPKTFLVVLDLLLIHMNFRILFWIFCEENHCNFDRDCIESVYYFFNRVIFTILILLVHEHGSSTVFYNLFLQCFIVFIVEILNFLDNSCA
jgi:hypothetical protein